MDRAGAIEFLKSKGYSRRISAKLVDIALLEKSDSAFSYALKHALEVKKGCTNKERKKKLKKKLGFSSFA